MLEYPNIIKSTIAAFVLINAVAIGQPINNYSSTESQAQQDTFHSELNEDIAAALSSSPDRYGIPKDMYFLDDSLLILKTQFESGRNIKTNIGISGTQSGLMLVGAGLLLVLIEISDPTDTWYYGGIPVAPLGAVFAVIGAGSILIEERDQASATSEKPEQLLEYFDRHYGKYMIKP